MADKNQRQSDNERPAMAPEEKFRAGLEYLNEEYPFFLTHVLNIGAPVWTPALETAAVTYEPGQSANDFSFVFNPDFALELDDAEIGFVAAHETMHILLNHLSLAEKFASKELFNLAADAVINDYLADQGLRLPDGVVTGEALIGEDCSGLTVTEVYERALLEAGTSPSGTGGEKGSGDESGDSEGGYRQMDSHDWIHAEDADKPFAKEAADTAYQAAKDTLPQQLDDIREDTPQSASGGTAAGSGDGALQQWRRQKGISLAWEDLLKQIDPDMFADPSPGPPPRMSWARRPRRLAGFPDTILPAVHQPEKDHKKGLEKPTIVMALDTSGSIGHQTANRFITLAKSIPIDKVNMFACTFTTSYRPLDLDNPSFSSGGTSFSPIHKFITERVIGQVPDGSSKPLKDYPKAVIVITDGHANFNNIDRPTQRQLQDNWVWLICAGGRNSQDGRSFRLQEFIK